MALYRLAWFADFPGFGWRSWLLFISCHRSHSLSCQRSGAYAGRLVLFANALSQQLPALFAPELLEAIVLALLRTLLIGGLIGLGAAWQRSDPFRWVMMNVNLRGFFWQRTLLF